MPLESLLSLLHLPQTPSTISLSTPSNAILSTLHILARHAPTNWKHRRGTADTIGLLSERLLVPPEGNVECSLEEMNKAGEIKLLATGREGGTGGTGTGTGVEEETMRMMELAGNEIIQQVHDEEVRQEMNQVVQSQTDTSFQSLDK